ncbi:MAG: choloylglycine hydrolase [Cellulosilyticum sp.]|nr:choloylglycine hydrolase [Cellulosilyticum sp.]
MCTALTLKTEDDYTLFGRNMDLEYTFGQRVQLIPRNYAYTNSITNETCHTKYAILSMGTLLGGKHPTLADGMNEKGLACAGLNFPDYISYADEPVDGKINIAPYDFMLWVLSNFSSIEELRGPLENINLVAKPYDEQTPIATLHWIIKDTTGACLVVESTKEKLCIYDNHIGVLTNSPTFDWHITHLNQYVGLSSYQAENTSWCDQELTPSGHGLGAFGLPGDSSSISRFVRIAFFKSILPPIPTLERGISEHFKLLGNVSMTNGIIIKPHNQYEITIYTSCMCLEKGIYYYNNYTNQRINAIDMHKEDLDATEIKAFDYLNKEDINYQN